MSLWQVAEEHLGDGLRYKEIFALNEGRAQTEDEVRELMSGNLCRCGAYTNIADAVLEVMAVETKV